LLADLESTLASNLYLPHVLSALAKIITFLRNDHTPQVLWELLSETRLFTMDPGSNRPDDPPSLCLGELV